MRSPALSLVITLLVAHAAPVLAADLAPPGACAKPAREAATAATDDARERDASGDSFLSGAVLALFGPIDVASGPADVVGAAPVAPGFPGVGPCESPADCSAADGLSPALLPDTGAGPPVLSEPPPDLGGGAPGAGGGMPVEPSPDLGGGAPGLP